MSRSQQQPSPTTRVVDDATAPRLLRRKLQLEVIRGADAGKKVISSSDEVQIGTHSSNDLALSDPAVSRYHLRVATAAQGYIVTDINSTNGTYVGGMRLGEVTINGPLTLELGDSAVRFLPLSDEVEVPLHHEDRLGSMVGRSPQMRELFAKVEAVAGSDATVLIEGPTGTGKELLAEEIHKRSNRKKGPFIIVDCGALPENLVESELFGHTRGSFTGATSNRAGAFELADGGTLFLDEIGEMDSAAQPRLLRALERRHVKRVGSDRYRSVDVRIVAATNRDLRIAVNESLFRADLYYRLSVVRLRLPPLKDRPEDIELLARHFLQHFSEEVAPDKPLPPLTAETLQRIVSHRWPGNVRELRNFMHRVAVMAHARAGVQAEFDPLGATQSQTDAATADAQVPLDLPYKEAKARWIDRFEVSYVKNALDRHKGNVAAAARDAGVDRTYLFRLINKYGLREQ